MRILLAMLLLVAVTGCIPAVVAGGTEAAVTVAQERSVGQSLDDKTIFAKIKSAFAEKDFGDLFANVGVTVLEGRVNLTGNVDKPDTQIEAVRIVWGVDGVTEVMNDIQVNNQIGVWNYTQDVWISTQIRNDLMFTKGIRSVNYTITTVNQVVYINGIAQNQQELERVNYIASATKGVQKVVSYVRLKTDPRRDRVK